MDGWMTDRWKEGTKEGKKNGREEDEWKEG
jgi:hypothetical protein